MAFMENLKFCCQEKRRLLTNNTLFTAVVACPPFLLLKEIKPCRSFKYTVTIRNMYSFPRTLRFANDFPREIKVLYPPEIILLPDACFPLDIFFEPTGSKNCYKDHTRYSLVIYADHPNVAIDVPVIIKKSQGGMSIPDHIAMPRTSPKVPCYYAFPIINFSLYPLSFKIQVRPKVTSLRYMPCKLDIPSRCHCMVYLEVVSENMCPVFEELILRSSGIRHLIKVEAHMTPPILHPSDVVVRFPCTQLGVRVDECILLCNETDEDIKYKWCRKPTKKESLETCPNVLCPTVQEHEVPSFVKAIDEYFQVRPKSQVFSKVSSESAMFSFTPPEDFDVDDSECAPYEFTANAYLACSTDDKRIQISLIGLAVGPEIELIQSEEDLGTVFVGERKCLQMIATNSGEIKGKMEFFGTDGKFGGIVKTDPNSVEIEPKQSVWFTIEYFAKSIGTFIEKLCFRIKHAKPLYFILKGTAVPLNMEVNPIKVDFGDIPFAILQKQYLEITNPLKIPVVISPQVENNGVGAPMILFIDEEKYQEELEKERNVVVETYEHNDKAINDDLYSPNQSHKHYSFWTLDPSVSCREDFQNMVRAQSDDERSSSLSHIFDEGFEDMRIIEEELSWESSTCSDGLQQSTPTTATSLSKISVEFHKIFDNTTLLAVNLVTNAIKNRIPEDPEPEDKIISTVLDDMYTFEYVNKKAEQLHYIKRKWTKIPENPREVLLESHSLHMEPNQTIRTLICIAANRIGLNTKTLNLRMTPISENFEEDSITICSRALSIAVPITYNCIVPVLHLSEAITNVDVYLERCEQFFFRIKNLSKVGGFVCFNIIPKNDVIELLIYPRKFLIPPEGWRRIQFKVTSFRVGQTVLTGVIGILGNPRPMIYKIIVNTKPPAVSVEPLSFKGTVKVLDMHDMTVNITNISELVAYVQLYLEKPAYMTPIPPEVRLIPGESAKVTTWALFQDSYKQYTNTLYVCVQDSPVVIKVNIKMDSYGIPIRIKYDEDPVKDEFDMGTLFTSPKPYVAYLTIINDGERPYTLYITKKKKSKENKLKFSHDGFKWASLKYNLKANEHTTGIVGITGLVPQTVLDEFSFDGTRNNGYKRIHVFNLRFKATFVNARIKWSKEELCFNIKNSQLCDATNIYFEEVVLENKSELPVEVLLKVEGSFIIFFEEPGKTCKSVLLKIKPHGSGKIAVGFTPEESGDKLSAIYQGRVTATLDDKFQKPLRLIARTLFPVVEVNEEELDYFARKQEFYAYFKISNPGQLTSVYKWQLIEEIEYPLNYINTLQMQKQKNVSQQILAKPPYGFLDFPINLEEEYLRTLPSLANMEEESDDEEDDDNTESTTTDKSVTSKATKENIKKNLNKRASANKVNETENAKNKNKTKELGTKSKQVNEIQKPKSKGKSSETKSRASTSRTEIGKKKKKGSSAAESKDSTPELSVSSFDMESLVKKIAPQISVELQEIAEEVDEFLHLNFPKEDFEDLEPENCAPEINPPDKYIYLDRYQGCVDPEGTRPMNIYFAGHEREVAHRAHYELEVAEGNITGLDVTVYNVNAAVQISKTDFEFGSQPWYKVFQRKIKITNCNQMTMKINIAENAYLEKYHKLYKGFVTVNPHGMFYILNDMIVELTVKVYMGFAAPFKDGFGVEVNNNMATPITFAGKAMIPMVSILDVERPLLECLNRKMEYKSLNKLFLSEVGPIEVFEPEPDKTELYKLRRKLLSFCNDSSDESLKSQCYAESSTLSAETPSELTEETSGYSEMFAEGEPKLKDLYIGKDGRVLKFKGKKLEHRAVVISALDKEMEDYNVLDYPNEYPPILYIEKMLETYKFLEAVKVNEDVRSAFRTLAKKYVLTSLKNENKDDWKKKTTVQIKDFVVRPLPFHTTPYYIPFDCIRLNEQMSVTLELFAHGPGKLALAAKTIVFIPGLEAEFCEANVEPTSSDLSGTNCSDKKKILVYTLKPEITEQCKFKYVNKTQRDNMMYNEEKEDSSVDNCEKCKGGFLCRTHSYDLNLDMVHTRDVPDRKLVNAYYNQVNKEQTDKLVLCQLFQEDCAPIDETSFALTIKFFPSEGYFEEGMIFEEYLFIDVHMGPTIPILLRGPIKSSICGGEELSEISEEIESKT